MLRVVMLLAVCATLLAGCGVDWFPAASTDVITVTASSLTPGVGGNVTITATVKKADGTAEADGTTVSFTVTSGSGTVNPSSAATSGGTATTTLTSNVAGSVTVSVTSGTTTPGTVTVNFGSLLTVSANPEFISATTLLTTNVTSTITAKLIDTTGAAVSGQTINFSTNAGSISPLSATTDSSGEATTTLTVPAGTASSFYFTVTATQAANTANTGSTTVSTIP